MKNITRNGEKGDGESRKPRKNSLTCSLRVNLSKSWHSCIISLIVITGDASLRHVL